MIRLVDHLKALGMSSRDATKAMKTGKVFYGGVPTADAAREVDPARVEVRMGAPRIRVGSDPVVLHKDAHVVVAWKPPAMLAVPATRRGDEPSVLGVLSRALGGLLPVHRLDEGTSGVMMFARTEPAQLALKRLLEHHHVERRYLAVVAGRFPREPVTVRDVLVRDRGDGLRGSVPEGRPAEGGREAVTHLRLVEPLGAGASLVEAQLETGRTHQVRIHLAELGHPVLGDTLYDPRGAGRRSGRLALHAYVLRFAHPADGRRMAFEIPLADDLERLRRRLRGSEH